MQAADSTEPRASASGQTWYTNVRNLVLSRDAPARVLFAGVLLTFFGSAYYHLAPSDARLVWDRLPMTLVFMSLLASVFGESMLIPLLVCGAASVVWWRVTGDLRLYALVRFGSMLALLPALWFVPRTRGLWPVYVLYFLAKLAEYYDRAIYAVLPLSGHTLKHLFAAAAVYGIPRWMRARDNSSEVLHNSRRTSSAGSGILRP